MTAKPTPEQALHFMADALLYQPNRPHGAVAGLAAAWA